MRRAVRTDGGWGCLSRCRRRRRQVKETLLE